MGKKQDEFEYVAMPHTRSLLRVARRLTLDTARAEDLVQDTLLLAWRGFAQFRSGTNVRAWLFRIMFNSFYGGTRKVRSAPEIVSIQQPGQEKQPCSRPVPSALDAVVVANALAQLSAEHRAVLLLGVVEGLTCQEMAHALSVPMGTVMSRLSRARHALRTHLEPVDSAGSRESANASLAASYSEKSLSKSSRKGAL